MHLVSHQFRALRSTAWLLACASIFISARVTSAPTSDPADQLRRIESFAVGGIGVAGTMSEGERSLRNLLEDPVATVKLEGLLTKATPAGQLYALLGLRLHDRAAFERAAKDFHMPDVEVETIAGCIIWHAPFKQLLDRIKAGQYDQALTRPAR
jgi:hypothetical protein